MNSKRSRAGVAQIISPSPRFVPISLAGIYSYRGTIGKSVGPTAIPDIERITWKGRRDIIAYDADAQRNPKVRAAQWQLSTVLIERGATVGILEWPIEDGKGIDDWLAKVGPDDVLAKICNVTFSD